MDLFIFTSHLCQRSILRPLDKFKFKTDLLLILLKRIILIQEYKVDDLNRWRSHLLVMLTSLRNTVYII